MKRMSRFAQTVGVVLCAVMVWIGQGGAVAAQRGVPETALAPAGTAQRAADAKVTTAGGDVLQRRVAHLRRGINVSDWFAQAGDPSGYTKEHFDSAITAHDLDLIQAMGFDHVRLSVDPRPMFHAGQADQITPQDLAYLDAAVKMILDRGLAVDISIFADAEFKAKLASDDEFVEQFADFWRALARHYANLDAERVFFEILNEPGGRDRYRWYGVGAKLAGAIREAAPHHTIIATGAHWSDDDDLVFLEPLRDPNVIYSFHFYESHIFTHQERRGLRIIGTT
jgi:endoglucanase